MRSISGRLCFVNLQKFSHGLKSPFLTWLLLLNRDSHKIPLPVGGNHMSLDRNSIKEPIRQFIAEYGSGKGITGIADDEYLLKRNVFDSLGTFRLIAFVEEAFPLTVDEADIAPENFETINLIEAFVMRKVGIEEPVRPPLPVQQGELAS